MLEECWNMRRSLDSSEWESTNAFLRALQLSQNLTNLVIHDSDFLDTLASILPHNTMLRRLRLEFCEMIDIQFPHSSALSLSQIEIVDCGFLSNEALRSLVKAAPNLTSFHLSTSLSEELDASCLLALKNLEQLTLDIGPHHTLRLSSLTSIPQEDYIWPHLRELSLSYAHDEVLKTIGKSVSSKLRFLSLCASFTESGLSQLLATLTDVESVRFSRLDCLTNDIFRRFIEVSPKSLSTLELDGCLSISSPGIDAMLDLLPNLTHVHVISCPDVSLESKQCETRFKTTIAAHKQRNVM